MNHHTDGTTKKRVIALLLFILCIVSIAILVYSTNTPAIKLRSFTQADSLVVHTLRQFNVNRSQMQVSTVAVDSNFVRKTYTVGVPPQFSKTLLHAELNRAFHPLSVRTPAHVSLTEEQMTIHLVYNGSVFRTVRLQTDESLIMDRNVASLVVAFTSPPSPAMLDAVVRFGEPIPIALQITSGEQAREQLPVVSQQYRHVCFWIQLTDENKDFRTTMPPTAVLKELPERSTVLSFQDINDLTSQDAPPVAETVSKKNITMIDVSEAMILDSDLGESFFKQELEKFSNKARKQQQPVAIVMADQEALDWLREKLAALKKSGLHVIHPPEIQF